MDHEFFGKEYNTLRHISFKRLRLFKAVFVTVYGLFADTADKYGGGGLTCSLFRELVERKPGTLVVTIAIILYDQIYGATNKINDI